MPSPTDRTNAVPREEPPRSRVVASMVAVSLSAGFLVGGYEFVRAAAPSLFMERFGAENMPYALAATPIALLAFIYLFTRALSALGSLKSLLLCFLFVIVTFAGVYVFLRSGFSWIVAPFFVFVEVYIVLLIEQYWSFINSTLSQAQAKIYNGPILGGAAVGPFASGWIVRQFAERIGTESLILAAAATLIPAGLLVWLSHRLVGEPQPASEEQGGKAGTLGLSLIGKTRPLLVLLCVVFLSQLLATSVNLKFYEILEAAMPMKDARTAALGTFWMTVNGAAFALQFVAAPILLRFLSTRVIMIAIPVVHIINAALLIWRPELGVAAFALLSFKSLDYSLFRASKETLYIPLSYDARYRAKQIIDALTYRFSKGVTAGVLSAWKAAGGLVPAVMYPVLALGAAVVWFGLSFRLVDAPPKSPQG